jgi:DNA-directed RNA polymerase subunit N
VGDKFEDYQSKVGAGKKPGAVLDELGFKRYCCRRMFLSHVDIVDEIIAFK